MRKYEVISPITGLPEPYEGSVGEVVELDSRTSKQLVAVGALLPIGTFKEAPVITAEAFAEVVAERDTFKAQVEDAVTLAQENARRLMAERDALQAKWDGLRAEVDTYRQFAENRIETIEAENAKLVEALNAALKQEGGGPASPKPQGEGAAVDTAPEVKPSAKGNGKK